MTTLLDQVQARLETVAMPPLKGVSGAADFATLADRKIVPSKNRQPAAWVVPLSDRATPNALATNAIRQTVTERFGVVLAATDASDGRGDAAAQDIDAIRRTVRDALLGWLPTGFSLPATYAGGQSMGFARGAVWYLAEFSVQEIIGTTGG